MRVNQEIIDKCKNEELKQALKKLYGLNKYYSLLSGDIQSYVKTFETVGRVPEQLKEWLKIFDGGFLFSVSMFSTRKHIDGQGAFISFPEINSDDFKQKNNIPKEIVCFAMANYGNYYFFDSTSKDEKIYEWDTEENAAVDEWQSFSEWLNTQIQNAESDIKAGLLEPMED